jgi:hypothetical protein
MRFTSTVFTFTTLALAALVPESASGQAQDAVVIPTASAVGARDALEDARENGSEALAATTGPCAAWDVTYALSGTLRISDTPMAAGDGVHAVGPGALVLRFDDRDGAPAGRARVLSFEIAEHFAVHPQAVLWRASVVTDASARAAGDRGVPTGLGTLEGDILRWQGPIRGYRTDGALTCDGSLCGRFGAPPQGRSPLHVASGDVHFQPLRFRSGGSSFEMPYSLVAESESPKQRTFLAIDGHEVRRACTLRPSGKSAQ